MWETLDIESFVDVFSTSPSLLLVGTDPDEWWTGSDGVNLFAHQLREMPSFKVRPWAPSAFSFGSVGWFSDQPHFTFDNGVEMRARLTATLVVEAGHWKIVQWHVSTAQSNEEVLGSTLTTNVDEIEHRVRVDRPDVSRASAPDGTVTLVFSDIESSTVLLERLGDTEFMRMLAWHDRIVRACAEEHRGYIVKAQGDGFMLAFPSAAYALRSCLAIREKLAVGFGDAPVRVRAGLHSGEALRHDDDFFGRTVVIAARISSLALGGEILASDLVHALTRGLGTFTFGESRPAILKGLEGEFRVYPVLA
jgi:class 3 adenylate cyclase